MPIDGANPPAWLVCSLVTVMFCVPFLVFALYLLVWAAIIYALIVLGRIWLIEDATYLNIGAFIILSISLLKGSYSQYMLAYGD